MNRSGATTVSAYLKQLAPERRKVVSAARQLIRRNLPKGYREAMTWGMISYEIPLERYPDTYNRKPLTYACLAAQKHYYTLYLMGPYGDPAQRERLESAFKKAGKKLDMGGSCLRFRRLEDLEPNAIGRVIRSMPPKKLIAAYE
ncbi:MAG: DUF1801 domain-containing protein, partial [Betaproteobacteria bacterium]|nr:DUF1801 domain-containing protein [Betaproteobacteria bacterium]